jgi:hypothetical protein
MLMKISEKTLQGIGGDEVGRMKPSGNRLTILLNLPR